MANEFTTGKSILILAVVAGCFAILWPNVFYPMIQGSFNEKDLLSTTQEHLRQERPPHLRPEFLHPALREKGRAIVQSHVTKTKVQEGRPGTPLPGVRPPMGGPGQVVPPPKGGGGTMGIVMPMYTIGIIVFFLYTMMKLIFRKSDSADAYENFSSDPLFRKSVLNDNYAGIQEMPDDCSKIVITAITGLVEEVNRQIRSDQTQHSPVEKENEDSKTDLDTKPCEVVITKDDVTEVEEKITTVDHVDVDVGVGVNEDEDEDDCANGKSVVKVLGMEMTESCEHGAKWSRPPTPLSRPTTPQNIFIPGSLPSKSQLLVSDSHTETAVPDQDNAVVLTGKVTLSLIGLSENNISTSEEGKQESHQDSNFKSSETNGNAFINSAHETSLHNDKPHTPEVEEIDTIYYKDASED